MPYDRAEILKMKYKDRKLTPDCVSFLSVRLMRFRYSLKKLKFTEIRGEKAFL